MRRVSIIVSSYDRLSDCWAPFFHGLRKYWPTCSYPVFLITNNKGFVSEGVSVLRTGTDQGWSKNLLLALEQIDTPFVMYFQEDYWISEAVDTSAIEDYVAVMETWGVNYIRLLAFPQPDADFPGDHRLGVLADSAPYRTAVQISLWRTEVLRELIDPRESPWQFEVIGTERSRKYGNTFLSVKACGDDPYYNGIRYVCTAVNQGRWSRDAKAYAERESLVIDFSNLPTENWWHECKRSSRLGGALGVLAYRINLVFRDPSLAWAKLKRRISPDKLGTSN